MLIGRLIAAGKSSGGPILISLAGEKFFVPSEIACISLGSKQRNST